MDLEKIFESNSFNNDGFAKKFRVYAQIPVMNIGHDIKIYWLNEDGSDFDKEVSFESLDKQDQTYIREWIALEEELWGKYISDTAFELLSENMRLVADLNSLKDWVK